MNNGFIYLSRTLLESDVFASQKLLKIWVWCLLKANFKDKSVPLKVGKGERIIKVKRGSFLFGRFKAEDELFIDGSTIYKSIHKLKDMHMIKISSNNQYSIISVCNYDKYQDANKYQVTTKEQPSNNQVTTKEQPSNTTKNDNNDNNEKNINIVFDVFWDLYDKKVGDKNKLYKKWVNLKDEDRVKIIKHIPKYKLSQPDKKYRKDPQTYFNNYSWNDEIIGENGLDENGFDKNGFNPKTGARTKPVL